MAMKNVMTQRPRSYLTDASFFSTIVLCSLFSVALALPRGSSYGSSHAFNGTPPTHPRAPIYSISFRELTEVLLPCALARLFPLILNVGCEGHVVSSSDESHNGLFLF
jgi:hypothetical protein